jgi:hypothetical protein
MSVNGNDKLAALAVENCVLRARQDDVEFLKSTGEQHRLRPEMPGEFLDGWKPGDASYSDLVLVMICSRGGICRRQFVPNEGAQKRPRRRPALTDDKHWFAEHPDERYRVRPLLPFEAPRIRGEERAAGVTIVSRDPDVAPYSVALGCREGGAESSSTAPVR